MNGNGKDVASMTPEQRAELVRRIRETQALVRRGLRYRWAGDDATPTIPVPPPPPEALKPARKPRTARIIPWDERPTTPPPAPVNYPKEEEIEP